MKKIGLHKYYYTVFLGISLVIVGIVGLFDLQNLVSIKPGQETVHLTEPPVDVKPREAAKEEFREALPEQAEFEEPAAENREEIKESEAEFFQADISYFDDALFIGDSRTAGLWEYGGLGNAEVLANSGMNIYKVFTEEFKLTSGERTTLETVLSRRSFGKIYIMLGINELGYDFDQTVERFRSTLEKIHAMQPEAILIIQGNLYISKSKSEQDDTFNNTNIHAYNEAISRLADGKQIFYLDANHLFEDGEGNLSDEFTTDHAHILGKYYVDWVAFILENAIRIS